MKKKRTLSGILALLLLLQGLTVPAWAETTAPPEPSESTGAATEPIETTEFVIPEDVPGDASVSMGSSTLDAAEAVIDVADFEATGKAALAFDLNSGTMLYALNPDEKMYPASTTKIMTCLLALELCDLDEVVTVTADAIEEIDWTSSSAGLVDGEELTMEQLLYCLMVKSANDAACVIADHLGGSQEAFVEMMNERAKELGCTGTNFVNVHGLHDEEHYTTARDMAKIMCAALENEMFCTLFSTASYTVPATNLSEARELETTNYLMDPERKMYDSRVIGGKTGFTTPAGRCLVCVSEANGMKLVTVVMGTTAQYASDGWTIKRYGNFEETVGLMDLIYNGYKPAQILSPLQILEQFQVSGGECAVQGYVTDEVNVIVPVDAVLSDFTYDTRLNGVLTAPVRKDDKIGYVRVWYRGQCLAQADLFAAAPVAKEEEAPKEVSASAVKNQTGLWKFVLIAIVAVVLLIMILVLIGVVRNAMYQAKRKRRRKARQKNRVRSR